jgi:predicted peptidase
VVREIRLGGETHRYAIWRPPGPVPSSGSAAILFLHGSGESGTDGEKPTRVGLGPQLEAHPERWPFVVIFPQKPREDHEWEEHEALVLAVLEDAIEQDGLDPRRIGLTGMSQGGHGAWVFGARHAERWASVAPVCGYAHARTTSRRIAGLPVWAFHGLKDDLVLPHDTQAVVMEIREARRERGLDPDAARMTLFPDANHNAWDPAYAEPELAAWFRRHTAAEKP